MRRTLTVIADFNTSVLTRYVTPLVTADGRDVHEVAYAEIISTLASREPPDGAEAVALVWARPESISPAFRRALAFEAVAPEDCVADVDAFADALLVAAARHKQVFVVAFALSALEPGYGILEWRQGLGLAHHLAQMNLRLAERLSHLGNAFVLDSRRWQQMAPPPPPKLWYAAKLPFAPEVFRYAAEDLSAGLAAVEGRSRRLVIVDLDDTLWGGIVGETGWEGLRLGELDHIGEAYADFQQALKALTRRGVQVAIVSKNEEDVALDAIDHHPAMVLRRADFAAWRINWADKAQNVGELLAELNLGSGSAVFIDDNPVERDRVRSQWPDVLVPEWPTDPSQYVRALHDLRCFDTASITAEDRARTQMYVADRHRRDMRAGSLDEWLTQLDTRVTVEPVHARNLRRVDQLLNKTNQLNLTTRRLSAEQISEWAAAPDRAFLAVSVADRFGDLGLTGLVSIDVRGPEARIVDYLLSCRVMGRAVEDTLLFLAVDAARRLGATTLHASYRPTPRNAPTLKVFRASAMTEVAEHEFAWDCTVPFPKPPTVTITDGSDDRRTPA